ncbi:putative NAD(P)/FAD-binding protein YdhS [Nocardia tenerifensis]|uniref:Putative NAD(P)/FAD-binding protein YdhS n=1 Tax=Nocardia tenerifensis TaxID=228006 RepID=A0A318JSE8_9NOCA|nr:FAD/NAD(P)-binding protein [Nocardia tenerifensis]PXX54910.1 putative NAD(P)/FAD-binding protein YdhS [Nocardia tenerifensis]
MVIVGGGAAGTLVGIQLLTRSTASGRAIDIDLVERTGTPGRGVAYHHGEVDWLMNTPIGRVSAFADDPEHLLRWARARAPRLRRADFLPRARYGDYLAHTLAEAGNRASGHARLMLRRGAVTEIRCSSDGYTVELADGSVRAADLVVLATGNPPAARSRSARWITDPWTGDLDRIDGSAPVLLVGTGLTMVDVAFRLEARFPEVTMVASSRHGLLPRRHRLRCGHSDHRPAVERILGSRSLSGLVSSVRSEVRAVPGCWREIVDELRPHTQLLWDRSTMPERARFLRRFGRFWDVHRHRLPPESAARLDRLLARDRLRIRSGAIGRVTERPEGIVAEANRGGAREWIQAGWVVDCTGLTGLPDSADALWPRLVRTGLARWEPLRIGADADELGRLRSRDGCAQARLLTLGAPLRGTRFETTAIPEIRAQADALSACIFREFYR